MDEYKGNICKAFDIPIDVIQRASSDWIFNATIIDQMKESGKAVAIMTNGATWNSSDKKFVNFSLRMVTLKRLFHFLPNYSMDLLFQPHLLYSVKTIRKLKW